MERSRLVLYYFLRYFLRCWPWRKVLPLHSLFFVPEECDVIYSIFLCVNRESVIIVVNYSHLIYVILYHGIK